MTETLDNTHKQIKVSKFGGSSMKDLEAMERSAKLAIQKESNLVVVSATYGTTNQLIELSKNALLSSEVSWNKCKEILNELTDRHLQLAKLANLKDEEIFQLEKTLKEATTLSRGMFLLKECSNKAMDSLLSIGERLSSLIFSRVVNNILEQDQNSTVKCELIDARKILRTDKCFSKALPDISLTERNAQKYLYDCIQGTTIFVTQGFIGATNEGETTTLGRGGSDYSASLFAEAIGADILEIWTDVAGIATTDPRICPKARAISEISYREAAQMATFGAKVLHPTTLTPAIRKNIKVFVGSSYQPDEAGTWIKHDVECRPLVRALTKREHQGLITIRNPNMLDTHGFLYSIFEIFERFNVSADALTTSEITVSITVDKVILSQKLFLNELAKFGEVMIEDDFALVSIIGNKINHTSGLARRIFESLQGINVRLICLGASEHNFCVLVNQTESNEAISKLHKEFIENDTNDNSDKISYSNPSAV